MTPYSPEPGTIIKVGVIGIPGAAPKMDVAPIGRAAIRARRLSAVRSYGAMNAATRGPVDSPPSDEDQTNPLIWWRRAAELSRLALVARDKTAAAELRSIAVALVHHALNLERMADPSLLRSDPAGPAQPPSSPARTDDEKPAGNDSSEGDR